MSLKPETQAEGVGVGSKTRGFPQLTLRASKQGPFCGYPGLYRRMFRSRLKSGISLAEKSTNW